MAESQSSPSTAADPNIRRNALKTLLLGFVCGVILAVLVEAGTVLIGSNFHVVIPGSIYRCSQPSAEGLERLIDKYRIRTVVNLRGCCAPFPWYMDECRVTQRHGISQEDICFSAGRLPPSQEVQRLVEVLEYSDYPLLFHCYHGADRTGLASGVALLLKTNTRLEDARRQLSPRYGHVPYGRTGNLDRFFDLYSQWLAQRGSEHTRALFRQWVATDYCAGECRATIELLDRGPGPIPLVKGKPFTLKVRCYNTSVAAWKLRAGNNAGIHGCAIINDQMGQCVLCGKAGLFNAEVPSGGHVDLTFALEPIWKAGTYHLLFDMIDEQQGCFYQEGSEPLERELVVRE
jgi:hypothetical protein